MEAPYHFIYRRQLDNFNATDKREVKRRTVPIFDPPCDCSECRLSYYSRSWQIYDAFCYLGSFSNWQAQSILTKFVNQIKNDRAYLTKALGDHGSAVLRRWRNRSQPKRAALLIQINPDLPKESYARVRLQYAKITTIQNRQNYRELYLVSYLDVETLAKDPAVAIGLLQYRTQFSLDQWVSFDHNQLTGAWGDGLLDVHFHRHCVVMFGDGYGTLIPWEEKAAHRVDIIGFPRARLILEAQAYLMSFLRKLVESLLAGTGSKEHSGSAEWEKFVQTGLKKKSASTYWSDFTFGPFSAPPIFDIEKLYAQAKARLEATADHLELLQTEPTYMLRYSSIIGRMHLVERNPKGNLGYQLISTEIMGDIAIHWFWQRVCKEFEYTRDVYNRFGSKVVRGQALPKEIDDALGALELLLANGVHKRSMQLQALIPQRPGFSRWYEHQPFDFKTNTSSYILKGGSDSGAAYQEDPLWWCLMQLQGDPEDLTRFPYEMLFKYLDDHLASSNSKERSRLDEILYEKLSDYATIVEMLAAVRMHFPKCTKRSLAETKQHEDRLAWRRHKAKTTESPFGYFFSSSMRRFQKTSIPSGPRNEQWLQKFNTSHEALQGFWKSVYDYLSDVQDCGWSKLDVETLMRPIRVWCSDQYRSSLASKREEVLRDMAKPKRKAIPNDDLWLPLPISVDISSRSAIPGVKDKVKTRGARCDTPPKLAVTPPLEIRVVPNHVFLTKRALKAFHLVFPTSSEERKQSLDWDTFVWSMEDAGFKAQNGGGSIVIFEKLDGTGKINFHRPHPDPTLDPVMLQTAGRRINKWFGWTRNTFKQLVK